jgi:hypothetical protein
VLVKPGEYVENLTITQKNIVLASRFLMTGDTTYILSTIIDGDSAGTVLALNNVDSTAIVIGFTIRNGFSQMNGAGGIICSDSANVQILHNIIEDNYAFITYYQGGGGGILCGGSRPVIRNNKILNNIAYDTGTWYSVGGGIYCIHADPVIEYNIISGNFSCWGGGIGLRFSSPIIRNNIIRENAADP